MEILVAHSDLDVSAAVARELGERYRLVIARDTQEATRLLEQPHPLCAIVVGGELLDPEGRPFIGVVARKAPGIPRILIATVGRRCPGGAHRIVPAPWRYGAVSSAVESLRLRMHMRRFHRLASTDLQVSS